MTVLRALALALALALACSPSSAWALRIDLAESMVPTVFPRGRDAPVNAMFWVLEPDAPAEVRLVDASGAVVPARKRRVRLGMGHAVQVRPLAELAPSALYCIEVGAPGMRYRRSCVQTGTHRDEAPPDGGELRAVAFAGGELFLELGPGADASFAALEVDVRVGGARCRDLAIGAGYTLRFGGKLTLQAYPRGDGTGCLQQLRDPAERLVLRARWLDPAGNAGPWSARFVLPAGASLGRLQQLLAH